MKLQDFPTIFTKAWHDKLFSLSSQAGDYTLPPAITKLMVSDAIYKRVPPKKQFTLRTFEEQADCVAGELPLGFTKQEICLPRLFTMITPKAPPPYSSRPLGHLYGMTIKVLEVPSHSPIAGFGYQDIRQWCRDLIDHMPGKETSDDVFMTYNLLLDHDVKPMQLFDSMLYLATCVQAISRWKLKLDPVKTAEFHRSTGNVAS